MKVARSTYYKVINHTPSLREQENTVIRSAIVELYALSDKRLGADKMRTLLRQKHRIDFFAICCRHCRIFFVVEIWVSLVRFKRAQYILYLNLLFFEILHQS